MKGRKGRTEGKKGLIEDGESLFLKKESRNHSSFSFSPPKVRPSKEGKGERRHLRCSSPRSLA